MNAKWMRTVCVAACVPLVSACFAERTYATPALDLILSTTMLGQVSAADQLSREDVGKMLRQARAAITGRDYDQAEAILRRTERAGVHYPLLHIGPTPASVRRELEKARRAQGPAKPSANAQPADRFGSEAAKSSAYDNLATGLDPFARRTPSLPAAPSSQPPNINGGRNFDTADAATDAARNLPTMTPPVGNPFAPTATSDGSTIVSDDAGLAMPGAPAGKQNWELPDAPLPAGATKSDGPATAAIGLAPRGGAAAGTQREAMGAAAASSNPKQHTLEMLSAARQALDVGNVQLAEQLAAQASALGVPESQFLPNEDRPSLLAWDMLRAKDKRGNVKQAAANLPLGEPRYGAETDSGIAKDEPSRAADFQGPSLALLEANPRLALVPEPIDLPSDSAQTPAGATGNPAFNAQPPAALDAARLIRDAEAALSRRDRAAALELFSQAYLLREQLEPPARERLEEQLQMLSRDEAPADAANANRLAQSSTPQLGNSQPKSTAPGDAPIGASPGMLPPPATTSNQLNATPSLLEATGADVQAMARQLSAEVGKRQSEANRMREKDPQRALAMLRDTRVKVEGSSISDEFRTQLLRRLDITIGETEKYFEDHRAQIELDQQNEAVQAEVDRSREVNLKVQEKIAELVNEYNKLKDEQRFAEMEVVAQRLRDIAPEEQVVQQIWLDAKFIRRTIINARLLDDKETSFWAQLNSVEQSAVNPVAADGKELVFDQQYWKDFAKDRKGLENNRRTEKDLEIEQRLKTPVQLKYQDAPLSEVIDDLQQLSGVNIHLDPQGLGQEGVHSDTPVTINLNREVQLKSALNLILGPLHLSYVIKDEVLKITSEQLRDGELETFTYNVADLVIPIPNFVPNSNIGLQGLINEAHATVNQGALGVGSPAVLVNGRKQQQPAAAAGNDNVLAQQFNAAPTTGLQPSTVPIGAGPGGMGAGANADFDSLIDLIVSTVQTETWAENGGGEAEIRPFPTNLSLVISQTQAVHEEIADLLAQLRRLQDLQVTIEVRFIRLNDSFFERIGIDFDVNIEDRTIGTADLVPGQVYEPDRQSATVGLQLPVPPTNPFPNFTSDLDIPFRQDSFGLTTPFLGNPAQVASFGFAILSDIEAYFLIEAAQGDRRTNILNAPKVTLFNGQQAFVADAISQPFVIGVIPVVGEFAAAQQPVIVVLNEGTMMTIQAVVSDDRRYVRLTVVPFFTQIGDVDTFTFEGSSSTTTSSAQTDDDDDGKNESEEESEEEFRSGVTVQLPSFQFVSVVTTVSVPDGGTVLLGGIKRLSEGRSEIGVPLLSKVPYINRLFKNVGIGRETDSLMMMVTPRIIIQEEEEERLGIATAP